MESGTVILILLAVIQATCGQTVDLDSPPAVVRGSNTVLTCTATGGTSRIFLWQDVSENNNIFNGGNEAYPIDSTKYDNFNVSEAGDTSIMTIWNTQIEDEGRYTCSIGRSTSEGELSVEVQSTRSLTVASPLENGETYEATCEALNGRPEVTITWMIGDNGSPCDGTPVETEPTPAEQDLFSKRSVCTFRALSANNGDTLRCIISGHQVSGLNGEENTDLVIHSAPARTDIMTVEFQFQDPNYKVSCDIADENQPFPNISNYYITANDTLIHQSSTGVNFIVVLESEFSIYTVFLCVAGNYLGNTTSDPATYPTRTTTPSPPAEPITTEGPTTVPPTEGPGGLSDGAIAGIAIGAVLLIVIIILIIYFVCIREKPGPSGASSTKKHGSSTVGTSNGSEKDKIKPVAAPRDQGSIQHTTDNPGQAEYAMVDRKKPGVGDMPDTRGPGQKEPPQGMLYADLDLSASAGHTEKKVPQNKDDVVVYSSILV